MVAVDSSPNTPDLTRGSRNGVEGTNNPNICGKKKKSY